MLTPEDRQRCVCISRALAEARQAAQSGAVTHAGALQQQVGGRRCAQAPAPGVPPFRMPPARPTSSAAPAELQVADAVAAGGGRVDYVEVVDARTLRPVAGDVRGRTVLIAVAAFFGKVRLIDNTDFEA